MNRERAARSVKWSVLENGGLAAISFLSLVVYARFLSVPEFGVFAVALAAVELLTIPVSMLFHDALVQRREVSELHYDTAFSATLAFALLLAGACWLIAPALAREIGTRDAERILLWMSPCLVLSALSATLVARRRRELDFRVLAIRSLAGRVAGAAAGIAMVLAGYGVWGLVAQQLLYVLVAALLLWAQSPDRPRLRFGMGEFRELIGFGVTSASAWMLNFCIRRAFVLVSGIALGAHGAGLLNMSFRVVDTLWGLAASAVSQIALPVLSAVRTDAARFTRAFQGGAGLACLTLYFAFALLAGAAAEVVLILFGPQWIEIAPYVTVLALQVLVQVRRLMFGPALTALGRPRDLVVSQLCEIAVVVGAVALLGVPSVGWAIGIWFVRELAGTAVEAWQVRRAARLPFAELLRGTWIPLAGALAMVGALLASRAALPADLAAPLRLAALALVGAATYVSCVALLRRRLLVDLAHFVRSGVRARQAH